MQNFNSHIEDVKTEILRHYIDNNLPTSDLINAFNIVKRKFTEQKFKHMYNDINPGIIDAVFDNALRSMFNNIETVRRDAQIEKINEKLKQNIPRNERNNFILNKKYLEKGYNLPHENIYLNINEIDEEQQTCIICLDKTYLNELKWACSYCYCEMHFLCGNSWLVNNKKCPGCAREENYLIFQIPEKSNHYNLLKMAIKICCFSIIANFQKTGDIAGEPYFKINLSDEYAKKYGFNSMIISLNGNSASVNIYFSTHEIIDFNYSTFKENKNEIKQFYLENQDSFYIDLIENIMDNILIY